MAIASGFSSLPDAALPADASLEMTRPIRKDCRVPERAMAAFIPDARAGDNYPLPEAAVTVIDRRMIYGATLRFARISDRPQLRIHRHNDW